MADRLTDKELNEVLVAGSVWMALACTTTYDGASAFHDAIPDPNRPNAVTFQPHFAQSRYRVTIEQIEDE